jgi:cobalamin biosynthesis protein CobT
MPTNPFESQLERLARTLTEQFGVTVLCQGDNACTDGKRILLPSLPEPMDEPLERMLIGYLDHELGHVAFSDFEVLKEFSAKHRGYEGLLNVVEDALVERRTMDRWPGVRANLDAMFRQVRGRVASHLRRADPLRRFCTAIYLRLSHHRDMLGLTKELRGYEDLLDQFAAVQDSQGSARLADALLDRWLSRQQAMQQHQPASGNDGDGEKPKTRGSGKRESDQERADNDAATAGREQPPPDDEAGAGAAADEPDDSQDASSAGGASAEDDECGDGDTDGGEAALPQDDDASEDNDAQEGDSDASSGPATGEAGGAEESAEAPTGAHGTANSGGAGGLLIGEIVAEAIAEAIKRTDGNGKPYRVFTKQHDCIEEEPTADDVDVQKLLATGADTVRRLRRGLFTALRSAEKRWWREEQDRGSLSPKTLHRLCLDRPSLTIFRTRGVVQGRSTAICIVLDASGSMTTQKMDVARDSLRVLLEALSDLRIPTEAFTFTTGDSFTAQDVLKETGEDLGAIHQRFSRLANLRIGLIKRYGEPVKTALRRLPRIQGTGLTPLGEAMQIGARRIIVRPELRRIMLVLTDGRAGCEAPDASAHQHAQEMAKRISQVGIELVGVGIKDDSLQAVIEDTIVVQQLEDLPAQLCKLLGRTLQKGLQHVG